LNAILQERLNPWRESLPEALGGLLDGTLRFGWGRETREADDSMSEIERDLWRDISEAMP
jgi:hypothetical protein